MFGLVLVGLVGSLLLCGVSSATVKNGSSFTPFPGNYCEGNLHPNASVYVGNDSPATCHDICIKYSCTCYDVLVDKVPGQWPCRVTKFSKTTAKSVTGYTAFVSNAAPGPNGALKAVVNFGTLQENTSRPFQHFWKSCGWCPPDPHPLFPEFFATEDVWQNHLQISSVPRQGIAYVRIHYLFDLIGLVDGRATPSAIEDPAVVFLTDTPRFARPFWNSQGLNFSAMDAAMDQLNQLGLYPGFEIMGNPGNEVDRSDRLFTNFTELTQIFAWNQLVHTVATRYIQRFGVEVVRKWRWESWNEPDGECKNDLTVGIVCDLPSFCDYFDASVHAINTADSQLIMGGPASDGSLDFLAGILDNCVNGTNVITREKGCGKVDFLNIHKKGNQDTATITLAELPPAIRTMSEINGTSLSNAHWGNDEADPKVGWSASYPWRGDTRYAAMVPRVIQQHQENFIDNNHIPYDVLSNDNGFQSYPDNAEEHVWQQRTLVARWMYNSTTPKTLETVRKPVLNTMALLSLLGTRIYTADGLEPSLVGNVGVLPTTAQGPGTSLVISALVWYAHDSEPINPDAPLQNVALELQNVPFTAADEAVTAVFALDETHGNSYSVYVQQGKPMFPSPAQLKAMRDAAEILMLPGYPHPTPVSKNVTLQLALSLPSVHVVMMCGKPLQGPGQVTGVLLHRTPTTNPGQVIVKWNSVPERCVRTYAVYYAASETSTPLVSTTRVNDVDTIFTSYLHALPATTSARASACYTVTAIDFWGRESVPSKQVCV